MNDGRNIVQPPALTVGEVTLLVQAQFNTLERLSVTGEIYGKLHSSGHWYGSLRDGKNTLDLILWRGTLAKGVVPPADGTQIIAHGKLNAYSSKYSLVAERLEVAGMGALLLKLEELKRKLTAEGLFDEARKRPIPRLPARIGIITSPTGAVIRDMLHRIADRCPRHVVLWPVAVQGTGAAAEMVAAVQGFNKLPASQKPDVLIIARGGGSLEDLMPFNDEALVRAVAASGIPVISGVGHEPDFTLCDFAASLRAPTPSAAAEKAVPVRADLLAELGGYRAWFLRDIRNQLQLSWERLGALQRLLPVPQRQLRQAREQLHRVSTHLRPLGSLLVQKATEKLQNATRVLQANNPEAPLARGFAHVSTAAGATVRSAAQAVGELNLRFADGTRQVLAKALILFAISLPAFAAPAITPVHSALTQGGYFVGKTNPTAKILWHGQNVPVAADGFFFIGFDRFEPKSATIEACDNGCTTLPLSIAERTYRTQNVIGVPPQTVNPNPKQLKQMKIDSAAINKARSYLSPLTAFKNPFTLPLQGPTTGVFGSRRLYGGEERSWHKGHDFGVPTGTTVHAPAPGIVRMAAFTFMNGNLIIIDHGQQLFSIYAHLSAMNVKPGDRVDTGQPIGKVGTTGRSSGPHLHWGAYWKNMAIDPILLTGEQTPPKQGTVE
ncbi:MAG TPA: exodeoxyribonuclease VII large subunit [Alphaproteobacteria bacterium]|nr:exodeoxyribonuclease VII large subunit [Alphaproteobacteria bacterium]